MLKDCFVQQSRIEQAVRDEAFCWEDGDGGAVYRLAFLQIIQEPLMFVDASLLRNTDELFTIAWKMYNNTVTDITCRPYCVSIAVITENLTACQNFQALS